MLVTFRCNKPISLLIAITFILAMLGVASAQEAASAPGQAPALAQTTVPPAYVYYFAQDVKVGNLLVTVYTEPVEFAYDTKSTKRHDPVDARGKAKNAIKAYLSGIDGTGKAGVATDTMQETVVTGDKKDIDAQILAGIENYNKFYSEVRSTIAERRILLIDSISGAIKKQVIVAKG